MWSEEGIFLGWSFLFFHKKSGLVERWTVKFRYTNDLIADCSFFGLDISGCYDMMAFFSSNFVGLQYFAANLAVMYVTM